jgi:hypothetical protein
MNKHESKTIDTFIAKEKRERYRFFLDNPKKRKRFLDCLNHNPCLDVRRVQELPSNADVLSILREHGSPERVYVISDNVELDGMTLPLEEAVEETEYQEWGTIISCIPGRLAYYRGEWGEGRALLETKQ